MSYCKKSPLVTRPPAFCLNKFLMIENILFIYPILETRISVRPLGLRHAQGTPPPSWILKRAVLEFSGRSRGAHFFGKKNKNKYIILKKNIFCYFTRFPPSKNRVLCLKNSKKPQKYKNVIKKNSE